MAAPTKMEFAVQMTCQSCVNSVKKALEGVEGIESVVINLEQERVVIESSLPSSSIKDKIESTGRRAVLQGYGSTDAPQHLGAAVAIMEAGDSSVQGVIRFVQIDDNTCVVDGTIDGLSPGDHALCIHRLGNLTNGCKSCGEIFSKLGYTNQNDGHIGNITANEHGRATIRTENKWLKVWDMIGRSAIIHQDDTEKIKVRDIPEKRLACGIIARSAGLFENNKKICACDGVTIWEERDVPVAGGKRSKLA